MPPRVYADNAATGFPKPPEVWEAMQAYARDLGASAGRGTYREAVEVGRILDDGRRRLARLIGAEAPEHVIFTPNGTAALNQAIHGTLIEGDHVVTTTIEHNSVLRPLNALQALGQIEATFVAPEPGTSTVNPEALLAATRPNTRLIALIHAGNVTGAVQPIDTISSEARRRGILFLLDAAQTAGHLPIDVQRSQIDLLAVPGHKGLMGPPGTGALYIRPGLETRVRPLIQGGTGTASEHPVQPGFLPDRFESGTPNAIGLAGLAAALRWLETKSVEALRDHDRMLSARFLDRTANIPHLTLYGPRDPNDRVAVFSVRLAGLEPTELSVLLENEYGILSRSGMHCAPLAHESIGTQADGGTTRLSFGALNTPEDVDRCADALENLAGSAARA